MNTTLSMWLGIAFLALAIVAVVLQAWLWGPKFWDEEAKKTRAPKGWLRLHSAAGYTYGIIYVLMMWHMVPRLWEYQYELPARTVIHAVVAVMIGVLLISKLAILIFFRHFEESMPRYGFGLLACTVILTFLSVPYAVRAHDLTGETMEPENVERVKRLLAKVEFAAEGVEVDALVTEDALDRGRTVLAHKCTTCHDMRTILIKPRTAQKWHDVSQRMLDKPSVFGDRLLARDIPYVTAYLVAITPEIQQSSKRMQEAKAEQAQREAATAEMVHQGDAAAAPQLEKAAAEALFRDKCTECHEVDETEAHGGDDVAGWRSVVAAMVEEGAEISDVEAVQLARYLAQRYPPAEKAPAAAQTKPEPKPEPEPEPEAKPEPEPKPEPEAKAEPKPKAEPKTEPKPEPNPEPKAEAKPKPKPKPKADLAAGKDLYMKKCKSCHGADGKGQSAYGKKIGSPDLTTSSLSLSGVTKAIRDGRSGTKMKAYGSKLSADELRDVSAFVKRF